MKISKFEVRDQRNVKFASCDAVPSVMIITGPNGCGKSTLLQALRDVGEGARPMYIGPHRASRRQNVRMRFIGPEIDMGSVLSGATLPGYEGIERTSNERSPWDQDEAPNFIKFGLCQIEFERTAAIAGIYDKMKAIGADSIPDVWKPLRDLCENLLPHLKFEKIDTTNRDKYQCLWRVHDRPTLIDIDDLSSGEKSIIQLFYPIIEHRIKATLRKLTSGLEAASTNSLCILMDEPELHLHPNLQGKILDYIRGLSVRDSAQFILATHSQTIVENSTSDELFLLRPSELVSEGESQLVKIASDDEKLAVLREVFGSTSNLTALRPLLVVEGRKEAGNSIVPSDARIYSFLSGEFSRITFVAGGGRSECAKLVGGLNDFLKGFSKQLRAHALLDRDVDEGNVEQPPIHLLPVSMVENLLVDPTVVWDATKTVHHKIALASVKEFEIALDQIISKMEPTEAARRLKARVGLKAFRLSDPVENAEQQLAAYIKRIQDELSKDNLDTLLQRSAESVERIKKSNQRREYFDGKKVLDGFFRTYMHEAGMSKEIFIYRCAEEASKRKSVKKFVADLMTSMGLQPLHEVKVPPKSQPQGS